MTVGVFDHPVLGGLLGDEEVGALFSAGAELRAMLTYEAAWARAEAEVGVIPATAARAIAATCESFTPDLADLRAGTMRDGLAVPALVSQLRTAVGRTHGPHVHFGSTSQDVIDTALVLRLQEALTILDRRCLAVVDLLGERRRAIGDRPLMGRTRMQQALPITYGDRIAAWSEPLMRQRDRLVRVREGVIRLQCGGAVGTLDKLGENGPRVAAALGRQLDLPVPARHWQSGRDGMAELAGWLSGLTGCLGKIGQDLVLMAQNEVAEVKLSGGGSSAMPHKVNPIGAEILVTLARFNATLVSGMHHALVHENERSGAAWTLEWMLLPQMTVAAAAALRHAEALVRDLDVPA